MARKPLSVVLSVVVLIVMASPLLVQLQAKRSLEEQAPAMIQSWIDKAFPGEYETHAVKGVQTSWTFSNTVPVPATVMRRSGSLNQVCVTFERDGFFGDWYPVGECVPAPRDTESR